MTGFLKQTLAQLLEEINVIQTTGNLKYSHIWDRHRFAPGGKRELFCGIGRNLNRWA